MDVILSDKFDITQMSQYQNTATHYTQRSVEKVVTLSTCDFRLWRTFFLRFVLVAS